MEAEGAEKDGQADENPGQAVPLALQLGPQPANPGRPTCSKPMPGAPNTWEPPWAARALKSPGSTCPESGASTPHCHP